VRIEMSPDPSVDDVMSSASDVMLNPGPAASATPDSASMAAAEQRAASGEPDPAATRLAAETILALVSAAALMHISLAEPATSGFARA
jgi:hypothetical protein